MRTTWSKPTLVLVAAIGIVITLLIWRRKADTSAGFSSSVGGSPSASPSPSSPKDFPEVRAARASASITGKVTDPSGAAIADASVCAFASSSRLPSESTRTPFCTKTKPDGTFTIRSLLELATYSVSASANGFVPAGYRNDADNLSSFDLKPGETRAHVDLILERGGVEVRGRVKDIAGGVIGGALVTINSAKELAHILTESNAAGEWSAWTSPGPISAGGMADGYTSTVRSAIAPGQFVEIVLTPESVLEGRVVEAGSTTPVVGALVTPAPLTSGSGGDQTVVTDAEGRFRIARLEPGRYKPQASTAHRWGVARESVLLGLAETSEQVIIEMFSAATISGRIVECKNKGAAGASVMITEKSASNHNRQETRSGEADENGNVQIESVLPGTYEVLVSCPEKVVEDKYPPIVVTERDRSITGIIWKVKDGLAIHGVVVDEAGAPIKAAAIQVRSKAERGADHPGADPRAEVVSETFTSDKNGIFHARGLKPGTYTVEAARDEDSWPNMKEPITVTTLVDRDVDNVRLVVLGGGAIVGTVTDREGAPITNVKVHVHEEKTNQGKSGLTADDGTFTIKNLKAGEYRVAATRGGFEGALRAPGATDDDVHGTTAIVRSGENTTVKLVVESQRGTIQGRVVGEQHSEAIPDAFVQAQRESDGSGAQEGSARRTMQWQWHFYDGNDYAPVLTNTDGSFTIGKLSPGNYTIRAFRKGGGESVVEKVKVGSTKVTLTIRTEGSISGTATNSDGKGLERFTISVSDAKTGVTRDEAFFRTNGKWIMRHLPEGNFHVVAISESGRDGKDVPLEQGQKKEGIALSIKENGIVRGRVVALDSGEPITGMIVSATPAKGTDIGFTFSMDGAADNEKKNITDTTGRFEVNNVAPGRVHLNVFPRYMEDDQVFSHAEWPAQVVPGGVTELISPIRVPKSRIKKGDKRGDLGIHLRDPAPGEDLEARRLIVSGLRPNGPASKSGLTVGDEIVSAEGYDVVGVNAYLFWTLSSVPEGENVTLTIRRGPTIIIKAGKRPSSI